GGVYIAASLLWLWGVEGTRPDRWDALGAAVCLGRSARRSGQVEGEGPAGNGTAA
ncbi:MAG: hypothetical protein ACE1ZB_01060, partial [Gammaproteobacteria bacterium]